MPHSILHKEDEQDRRRGLFPSVPAPLEQRSNPGQERQRGLTPKSPWDILTEPYSMEKGFLQSPLGTGARILRTLGETYAETGQETVEQTTENVQEGLSAYGEEFEPVLNPLVGGVQAAFGAAGDDDEEKPPGAAPDAEEVARKNEIEGLLNLQAQGFKEVDDIDAMYQFVDTPEGKAQLDEIKQQREEQLAQVNGMIANMSRQSLMQTRLYDDLFERQFGDEEFIPGATPEQMEILDEELGRITVDDPDTSLSPRIMEVIDAITESNLSEAEKVERLDFIQDRQGARTAIGSELETTMSQLVSDRRMLENILALPDAELLADENEFNTIRLDMDLQFDEFGRTMNAMLGEVEGALEQSYGADFPDAYTNMLIGDPSVPDDGILDLVANGVLEPGSDELRRRVEDMTGGNMADANAIMGAIPQGLQAAALRNDAWDTAQEQDVYEPGSWGLISAVFQAAMGLGLEAEDAARLAEDRNLHQIIGMKSGGEVGFEENGQLGIGGLTEEAYERVYNKSYDEIRGDPVEELTALIAYMLEPGNPAIRMQTFLDTGVWGN